MQSSTSKHEQWNTWNFQSRSKISNATTSKKWDDLPTESHRSKVQQKYPLRTTQSIQSPYNIRTMQQKPSLQLKSQQSTSRNPSIHSSRTKCTKQKQSSKPDRNYLKTGQSLILNKMIQKLEPRLNRTKTYAAFSPKSCVNMSIQDNNIKGAVPKYINNVTRKMPVSARSVKDIKDSLNAISLTRLKNELVNDLQQTSKSVSPHLTCISQFVDLLEIKPNLVCKHSMTKKPSCQQAYSQTEKNTRHELLQTCIKVVSIETQTDIVQTRIFEEESQNEDLQDFNELITEISQDYDNLIRIIKMYEYRKSIDESLGTQPVHYRETYVPRVASGQSDFVLILEDLFSFHQNMPEDSIFITCTSDILSECNNETVDYKDELTTNTRMQSLISMDNVELLNSSVLSMNQLLQQFNSVAGNLQKSFDSLTGYNNRRTSSIISHSDYKTADSLRSSTESFNLLEDFKDNQREPVNFDKNQICLYYQEHIKSVSPQSEIGEISNNDTGSLGSAESSTHNQIKVAIDNLTSEVTKLTSQMECFEKLQICLIPENGNNDSDDIHKFEESSRSISENGNYNSDDIHRHEELSGLNTCSALKDRLRLFKSRSDRILHNKKETEMLRLKLCIVNDMDCLPTKTSAEVLTSNFSTCSEISTSNLDRIEANLAKNIEGDTFNNNTNNIQSNMTTFKEDGEQYATVRKVVSTVSTNTDDFASFSKHNSSVFSLAVSKVKRRFLRRTRKRKLHNRHKNELCKINLTRHVDFKISDYYSTFDTKSKMQECFVEHSKTIVLLSQSPSVGDLKVVCKEFDNSSADSAVIVNPSLSSAELAVEAPLTPKPSKESDNIKSTDHSTHYPESSITHVGSNTSSQDIPLNEMKFQEISTQSESAETYSDAGIQMDVGNSNVGVQKYVEVIDRDISTGGMIDTTSAYGESEVPEQRALSCYKSTEDQLIPLREKHEIETAATDIKFGDELLSTIKETCVSIPQHLMKTVMTRLQYTFQRSAGDGMFPHRKFAPPKSNFEITSVRCIGDRSVLVKWTRPSLDAVSGYEILINNEIKAKIHTNIRTSTIIDFIEPKTTLFICVCAMGESRQIERIARTTFKMA